MSEDFVAANSLGAKSPGEIAQYLQKIGDKDGALQFLSGGVSGQNLFTLKRPWRETGFIVGFVQPNQSTVGSSSILGISQIAGDSGMIGKRIKISLDKFYVDSYPGFGTHTILCEFAGKNQTPGETEDLRFALQFKTKDKASASVSGVPIFMGVTVGSNGISFEGKTVNVKSDADSVVLAALDTPAFKSGLSLITAAQPALKPLAGLAAAAVKSAMSRSENCQVHTFNLGLDFSQGTTSARLQIGSYVVVQKDAQDWTWSDYEWNRDSMSLRLKSDPAQDLGFNYMVFGVSNFLGA